MNNLDSLLSQYASLQDQEAEIKSAKDDLKKSIIEELFQMGVNSYTSNDGIKGTASSKSTVKYDDEVAIIEYLKNNGMSSYLKTTIDTTAFNKTLKTSQTLQESLKGKFTVSEVPALTVKRL